VSIYVFSDRLRSPNPAYVADVWEAEIKLYFDGTQTPIATVSQTFDDPAPQFRYRVNLRTGTFFRV
jgi:hypothetical protein